VTWTMRSRGAYVPMRIIAVMDEPIAYLGDLLHIDGPIAYAAFHDLDMRTRLTIPPIETAEWPTDLRMPLSTWWCDRVGEVSDERLLRKARRDRDGAAPGQRDGTHPQLWGWCASAADDSVWAARGVLEVRKKPEAAKMVRYAKDKTLNTGAGATKAYDLSIPTVLAREVVWYAHGDPDAIQALLTAHVPAIGKKRNIGSGTVREWRVEQCDVDRSVVDEEGRLRRRIPLGAVDGAPGYGGLRPPYYHASRLAACVEP